MVTLDSFLIEKYLAGMIAREEVVTKAQDPVTIQAKLQELELAAAVGARNRSRRAGEGVISRPYGRRHFQPAALPGQGTGPD